MDPEFNKGGGGQGPRKSRPAGKRIPCCYVLYPSGVSMHGKTFVIGHLLQGKGGLPKGGGGGPPDPQPSRSAPAVHLCLMLTRVVM